MNVCVFCASSNRVDTRFFAAARQLGRRLAERGDVLIYGGGMIGLMGEAARAVHAGGGRVVGVIPERLRIKEVAYEEADELIVTADMRERKAVLEQRSDAFLILPGGFGTLEELAEILTHQHLGYHDKPIAFLNVAGFYDPLLTLFEHFYATHTARATLRDTYFVTDRVDDALAYFDAYKPRPPAKAYRTVGG